MNIQNRNLAAPAPFSRNGVPGSAAPTTAFRGVPGLTLNTGSNGESGFGGISTSSLLAQLGAGLVKNVAGFPSQEVISQPYVVRPWANQYPEKLTRGQPIFCIRNSSSTNMQMQSMLNLWQVNELLRDGYNKAKASGMFDRSNAKIDAYTDMKYAIAEDLEDPLDRTRRLLNADIQDMAKQDNVKERIKNTDEKYYVTNELFREVLFSTPSTSYLAYTSKDAILEKMNYVGISQNIENAHTRFKMINVAVGGPLDVDNYWGESIRQGNYLYLILKRIKNERTQEYEEFQFVPWAEGDRDAYDTTQIKYPSRLDTYYEDGYGNAHHGHTVTVGKVCSVDRSRIGNKKMGLLMAGVSGSNTNEHDAYRESMRDRKQTVFVALGKDAHDKRRY